MTWLNWPNRITLTRILMVVPLVVSLLNLNAAWPFWRHVALGLIAVMALSDALDGFLARRLNQETPLGRFLDPVADKLLIASAVTLLAIDTTGVRGFQLPYWVPVVAVGKDILVLIGLFLVYATTGRFSIEPRIMGKACTLLQFVMIAYCLLVPDLAPALQGMWRTTYWMASGMAVVALVDYLQVGTRVAADEYARRKR